MNRYYTDDKTKWTGRSHIGPGPGDNSAKRIMHFIFDGPDGSPVATMGRAYAEALAAVDDLRTQRETITATGKYMPLGVTEAVAKYASENSIPKLRRAAAAVEKEKSEIAALVSKLTVARPDPAEERQQERLLQRLTSMPTAERYKFINEHRVDPALRAAIASSTPLLSGVDVMMHRNMVNEQIEIEHGETLAELADRGEVALASERVVTLGRNELREIIGVDRDTFEQIATVSEKNSGRMPFRVDREVVNGQPVEIARVLDMETKSWRRASPEEITASRQEVAA